MDDHVQTIFPALRPSTQKQLPGGDFSFLSLSAVFTLFLLLLSPVISSELYAQNEAVKLCPCCGPEYRRFDFWLGDWVAYNLQDSNKLAGTNRIVLLQDSCVVQENWVGRGGQYTGTSYNWYDRQEGKWRQTWIDNQGGSLQLSGGMKGGEMILYSGEMKSRQGESYINRITWTPNPDGSVRQHWEISKDDGQSWETVFDGLYKRKE